MQLNNLKNDRQIRKMLTAAGGPLRPTSYLDSFEPEWKKEYKKGIQKIPEITVTGKKRYVMSADPDHQTKFIGAMVGPFKNLLSPTQGVRLVYDTGKALSDNMSFTNWSKSLMENNNGIVTDEFAEEHPYLSTGINLVGDATALGGIWNNGIKTLWNNGKLILKDIPRKAENFYRAVNKDAINDAKKYGIIRGRKSRDDSYPFFGRSSEPYHDTKYVIEGTPESADWISTYKYVYNKNPEIVRLPKIPDKDYSKAYDTIIGSPESNGFLRIGAYDKEFLEGYEALPMTNGQLNVSPSSNFEYWKKYPIIGWRKYNFKQGGKMNILEFLKNGSGIHIKEKNKGKFTSYCGGKVTDECILKGKNSSNPAIRKRATFAANARKWKHLDGGIIIAEKGIKAGLKAKQNLTKRKAPDWDNLDRGYRYLTQDMKLPHDLAIAIMGNVVEESQGNYKAVLKNGGGRGLIQWDGQPAPTGRYGLWGKIWASVAKPANVYDSKTDTMKNYWAPWGGLKGELVRLKFINAPLKTKTKIYAESYLRPGKPRIKDRQLSAMLLDSIYNPRIKNIIIDKEGGIIKAQEGTKFNWQSALTNVGTNLFNSYLQSRVQNNKINSEAEAAKAENEVDLNQYFWDIYLQELAKALLEEELKSKAISAMNDTVINSSPLVTLKIAYDKASKSYGNLKANLDARNKAIDEQAKAAKSSVITDAVSGVIQNGLGMLKDYYGSKNNNTSTTNTSTTSNSYFDNYVNTKYKKFGTFNSDGSMNMLGGTFTIKDGYKPNQPQLFNYQTPKLNV